MKLIVILIQLLITNTVIGQTKIIPGIILDAESKEAVIHATIYDTKNDKNYQSDLNGRFNIKIIEGDTINLYVNYTGYERGLTQIYSSTDTIHIELKGGLVGGVNAHFATQQYYKENKTYIDSMEQVFNNYDAFLKSYIRNKQD